MENEVYGAARAIPVEYMDRVPVALHHAIQEVTRNLVDRVICELEKGESICSLSTVEQTQAVDLNSVEIRRTVNIKKLVRCKECKQNLTKGRKYAFCDLTGSTNRNDWFCADGEREAQE